MTSEFIKKQQKRLKQKKEILEKELKEFAKKDPNIKGNWESKFPNLGVRTSDASEDADRVEEYDLVLPIEHALETELQKVDKALENIKKSKYGTCQKCKKKIAIKRLEAYPEADVCMKCNP